MLSPVKKLHYLRSTLSGEAAKALEVTNDNYEIAWRLLKQRYENKRLIVQYLIQTLIDLPIINKESYTDLRNLMDSVSQCTQSLTKLGQPVGDWGMLLIHIILPKIDKGSRREWELRRSIIEEFPTLAEFLEFLTSCSAFLESVSRVNRNSQFSSASNDNRSNTKLHHHAKNTAQAYITANALSCSICSENHKTHKCSTLRGMSAADRNSEIKRKRLCIKYLKAISLNHKTHCGVPANLQLSNQLEKFWKMEEINHKLQCSKEENECEAHFASTFTRNHEGRFIVELPLKGDIEQLGESYHIAERRFKTLERKLEKQSTSISQFHA